MEKSERLSLRTILCPREQEETGPKYFSTDVRALVYLGLESRFQSVVKTLFAHEKDFCSNAFFAALSNPFLRN